MVRKTTNTKYDGAKTWQRTEHFKTMPAYGVPAKKKNYIRIKGVAPPIMGPLYSPSTFERVVRVRFNHSATMLFTSSNPPTAFILKANNPFFPTTALTHQAYPIDLYASQYKSFTTLGSKCTVDFMANINNAASNTSNLCGVYCDTSSSVPSPGSLIIEQGRGVYSQVSATATDPKRLFATYSPKKMFGIKDVKDNKGLLGYSSSLNPTNLAFFVVWCEGLVGQSSSAVNVVMTVDYIVHCSDPINQAQS